MTEAEKIEIAIRNVLIAIRVKSSEVSLERALEMLADEIKKFSRD